MSLQNLPAGTGTDEVRRTSRVKVPSWLVCTDRRPRGNRRRPRVCLVTSFSVEYATLNRDYVIVTDGNFYSTERLVKLGRD